MDELDETLRRAARALDATTPAGTFDRLPARIDARLEGSMHSSDNATGPTAGGDDSGLHDIRALAETTQRRSRRQPTVDPDEALLTTSSTSLRAIALPQPARTVGLPAAPVASPAPSYAAGRPARAAEGSAPVPRTAPPAPSRRAWIAGAGVAGAAAVAAFVVIGGRGGEAPVAAPALAPVPAPVVAPAPPGAAIPEAPAPAATAATPPATETASPTTAQTGDQESAPAGGTRISAAGNEKRPAPARPATAAERPPTAVAAAPSPAAPAAKADRGPQTLDDLLSDASGGAQRGTAGGAAAPTAPVKRELGRADIKTAMSAVQGAARACYDRFGVAGTVGVKLVVASSGSVSKVQATGAFAGTPTGDCVVAAVQRASFPAWDGAPMTVQYSFLLSE
jgi:hypothetical protein